MTRYGPTVKALASELGITNAEAKKILRERYFVAEQVKHDSMSERIELAKAKAAIKQALDEPVTVVRGGLPGLGKRR